jgi:hypothetical protein
VFPFLRRALRAVLNRRRAPAARSAPRFPFPWWGWLGIAIMAGAWTLSWSRFAWFRPYQVMCSYMPIWIGFILLMNALCIKRSGHSPMTDRPWAYLATFPASSLFWWFFEYLNRCQASLQWGEPSAAKLTLKGVTPSSVSVESIAREASDEYRFFVVNRSMKSVNFKAVFEKSGLAAGWYDPVSGRDMPLKMVNGEIPLTLAPCGSGFLKLRKIQRRSARYPMWSDYMQGLISFDSLSSKEIKGEWKLSFGEKTIITNELIDWTKSEDDDLKYFSGTAVYSIKFNMTEVGGEKILSLGDCNNQIAKVILNGKELATLWCAPYEVWLPRGALAEGENELRIEFTNVWANRLIGDEQEIRDCDFVEAPIVGGTYLKSFPKWFNGSVKNRPSKGRRCFTDWNYFTKDSKLTPSGLLGPVKINFR